eukprot:1390967-Amphidinium_carterae.1
MGEAYDDGQHPLIRACARLHICACSSVHFGCAVWSVSESCLAAATGSSNERVLTDAYAVGLKLTDI